MNYKMLTVGYNLLHLPEPNWETEKSLAEELVARVNEMDPKPRFLVMCGDMLDALPFTKEERPSLSFPPGDRTLRQKQYIDFVKVFRKLDSAVKLICVCGNHDIGDVPTRDSLQYYRREFGKDYFSFWVGGVKFVVLNSQFMYSPDAIPEETARQLEFLDTIPDARAKFIGRKKIKDKFLCCFTSIMCMHATVFRNLFAQFFPMFGNFCLQLYSNTYRIL